MDRVAEYAGTSVSGNTVEVFFLFGIWLRAYRTHQRIGLRTMARELGVAASTLTRLERGERQPSLALLDRITAWRGWRAGVLDGLVLATETRPHALLAIADRALQRQSWAVLRRAAAKAARAAACRRQRDVQLLAMVYLAETKAAPNRRFAALQKVFDRAMEERNRVALAAAVHRMGHAHMREGAHGKAEWCFEFGLRILPMRAPGERRWERVLRARLLRDLAYLRHRQHDLKRARDLYRSAEDLAEQVGDARIQADCWMGRGLIALDQQQYREAADLTLRAIAIYQRLRVPEALCGAHINASLCYAALGYPDAQRRHLEKARSWARHLPPRSPVYGHLANEMGRVLLDLNRPADAERVITEGMARLGEEDVRERALSYRLLGRAARQQGRLAKALQLFARAQSLLADTPFVEDRLAVLAEIVHVYSMGHVPAKLPKMVDTAYFEMVDTAYFETLETTMKERLAHV